MPDAGDLNCGLVWENNIVELGCQMLTCFIRNKEEDTNLLLHSEYRLKT